VWDLCGSRQGRRSGGHGTRARSTDAGGARVSDKEGGDDDAGAGGRAGPDEDAAGGVDGADERVADGDEGADAEAGAAGAGEAAPGARRRRGSFAAPRSVRRRSGVWRGAGATTTCERTGASGADQRARTNVTPKEVTTAQTSVAIQPITDGLPRSMGSLRSGS